MSGNAAEGARYWAFISYSHKDAAFGRRLHRRLESYVLPRRLAGRPRVGGGAVPKRLVPIFRDRDELPAANDLGAEVRAALAASQSLIVVCSPAAARSAWVAREIEVYRALHPDRPVLAAMRFGEPGECFPPPLRGSGEAPFEPLAADFRDEGDGERLALLKLVAGILGLGLDELVQRDAGRRLQRVTAVTAASLAAMIGMGVLTAYALSARAEAERQRTEAVRQRIEAVRQRGAAEGLVEFMLTDLRDRLKGVGRLDVMTAVNERALKYYSDQELKNLPVDSLERRARILHAMGEDDETRGDHGAALKKFAEARRTTAALLVQSPGNPERVFDHAQSEFWMGDAAYEEFRIADARRYFLAYKTLAEELIELAPGNAIYRKELGYARGNLCVVDLEKPQDPKGALEFCKVALADMEALVPRLGFKALARDLANRHGWLADAYRANGSFALALGERKAEDSILVPLMKADPKDVHLQEMWVALQRAYGLLHADVGEKNQARAQFESLLEKLDEMIRFDPKNEYWKLQRQRIGKDLKELK